VVYTLSGTGALRAVPATDSASGAPGAPGASGASGAAGTTDGSTTAADPGQGFIAVRVLPDVMLGTSQTSQVNLPDDTFQHATQTGGFQLSASMADGSALPSWVTFDSDKGTFTLNPPSGTAKKLDVRITARDHQGRTATTGMILTVH